MQHQCVFCFLFERGGSALPQCYGTAAWRAPTKPVPFAYRKRDAVAAYSVAHLQSHSPAALCVCRWRARLCVPV